MTDKHDVCTSEPPSMDDEVLIERFETEGRLWLSLRYDGGGPGMSGHDRVCELDGQFAALSDDIGSFGPFATFEEAAASVEMWHLTTAVTAYRSDVLDVDQIRTRLSDAWSERVAELNWPDAESKFLINNVAHVADRSGIRAVGVPV